MGNVSFECRQCNKDYNFEDKKPRLLSGCDHTVCAECLLKMLSEDISSVKCVVCGKISEFPSGQRLTMADFPEDLATLSQVAGRFPCLAKKPTCQTHNTPGTHICLNMSGSCQNKDPCCLKCLKTVHADCPSDYILLTSEFSNQVIIRQPVVNLEEWTAKLKSGIAKQTQQLQKRLNVFVDATASLICYQQRLISYVSPTTLKFNYSQIDASLDQANQKITLSHKKQSLIDGFMNDVSDCIMVDLWKRLRAKENDCLTFAFRKHFLLKQQVTAQDEYIVDRLENPDMHAKEKYILPYLQFDSSMNLEEYGARLMKLCHEVPRTNSRTTVVNFTKLKPAAIDQISDAIWRVISDNSIPSFKINKAVEELLERNQPLTDGSVWRCVFNPTCFNYDSRFGENYIDLNVESDRFVVFREKV